MKSTQTLNLLFFFYFLFLFYHHSICEPLQEEYLLYSPGFFQSLDLLPDSLDVLLSRSPQLLLLRRVQGIHVELVNYELRVHPGHLIRAPSEHVNILHKKQQHFYPFFVLHTCSYQKTLVSIRQYPYFYQVLSTASPHFLLGSL